MTILPFERPPAHLPPIEGCIELRGQRIGLTAPSPGGDPERLIAILTTILRRECVSSQPTRNAA